MLTRLHLTAKSIEYIWLRSYHWAGPSRLGSCQSVGSNHCDPSSMDNASLLHNSDATKIKIIYMEFKTSSFSAMMIIAHIAIVALKSSNKSSSSVHLQGLKNLPGNTASNHCHKYKGYYNSNTKEVGLFYQFIQLLPVWSDKMSKTRWYDENQWNNDQLCLVIISLSQTNIWQMGCKMRFMHRQHSIGSICSFSQKSNARQQRGQWMYLD